jgi:GNAT superfamily N-acetyltransferase
VIRQLRQLRLSLGTKGLCETLYWAAYGYLRPNRFLALARDLAADGPGPAPAPGAELALWDRARVRAWCAGRRDVPVEFLRDEIDGVRMCAVATVGGDLAGLIWIYRPQHPSRVFRLAADEAELNHGFVRPAYRGRRLFEAILAYACLRLRQEGVRRVYGAVHSINVRSHRSFLAAGFRDIGAVRHFLLFRPRLDGRATAPVVARAVAPTSSRC